jgi:tripartite-type tricarboxylate transporter receptor subunit TctC
LQPPIRNKRALGRFQALTDLDWLEHQDKRDQQKDEVMRSEVCTLLVAVTGCMSGPDVLAAYPERPIRMIVPSAAGGQPDTNSRLVAVELSKQIGQQVVVDNRPGASSSIGFEAVARAQPDGYTIGYGAFPLATNPSLLARVPYDVNKDFRMVIMTNISPNIIAITPALPVNSVSELIAYAKRNPDQLLFGSAGSGGSMHLSMELFKLMTGTRMVHVPYKGMQQVITEIIGGRLQLTSDNVTSVLPHVTAGRLRALGVTGARRIPLAPDIPTVAEAGVPGYEITAWGGYMAPAGTPEPIVARLNAELNRVVASAAIRERWVALGIEPVGGTPERFAEHVRKETAKWTDVIKRAGIKGDY